MNQQIWSRERFTSFLQSGAVTVFVQPAHIVPCGCRDVNCHGWRLQRPACDDVDVPRELEPALELATV